MKKVIAIITFMLLGCFIIQAQSSAFTYQGKLTDGSNAANGQYDLSMRLFDAVSGGAQIGSTLTFENVQVTNGIFNVTLDFGSSPFTSTTGNYLDISVRPGISTDPHILLSPRQPISSSPYAVQTLRATSAATSDSSTNFTGNLGGDVTGTQASTVVTRLQNRFIAGTTPTAGQILTWSGTSSQWEPGNPQTSPGSPNYIQNTTSPQATSNFNISGNGTAGGTLSGGVVNTETQLNISGNRILAAPATDNIFGGRLAGINTAGGIYNTFFGFRAGEANIGGSSNSFFGERSGRNSQSVNNSFFGAVAGQTNTTGSNNTALGTLADVGAPDLNYATAIGAAAIVGTSDTIVVGKASGTYGGVGRPADVVQIPGNLTVSGNVGVGTSNPTRKLDVAGSGSFTQGVTIGSVGTLIASSTQTSYLVPASTGIGGNTCVSFGFPFAGANVGSPIAIGLQGFPEESLVWSAYVNGIGFVTLRLCNYSSASVSTTSNLIFNLRVFNP